MPFITSKDVETNSEQFECIANYLRDKKQLEKGFRYYVQGEQLECETFIIEKREEWLNQTLDAMLHSESSEEQYEDKETKEFKEMYLSNPNCFRQQLMELNYPDIVMKIYIYSNANKLSKKMRKKFLAKVDSESEKIVVIASSICFPEALFGIVFDEMFSDTQEDEDDDKETDYCIRKYVVDNNLIDTNEFTVEINPDNLDIAPDFNCTDHVDDTFEELEDELKSSFFFSEVKSRRQNRCLQRVIKHAKVIDYMLSLGVMTELKISDEIRANERKKFIDFMSNLYRDMAKC